ncbi:MAG: hypothetical protein IKP64_04410 [Selenomonadaceae bacterium]|nr:hypothetical protein [Selenomonadaceae bacterium]MBR4382781.1 hypothetical protein [Selenomonadaceae bacterium]
MADKNNAVIYGEVIAKCWDDEDFKKKFLADPESVLADAGFKLEEGVTYKIIEAPKLVKYVVIPHEGAKEVVQKISAGLLNRVEKADVVIPEGVEVRIIQNTDDVRNLILPASPKTLTAAELKAISGGDSLKISTNVALNAELAQSIVEFTSVVTTEETVLESSIVAGVEVAVGLVVVLI